MASINRDKKIEVSQGILRYIEECNKFYHNCNNKAGYSEGPIILINNSKIIGIHRGYEPKKNKNVGIYMNEITKDINKYNIIEGIKN